MDSSNQFNICDGVIPNTIEGVPYNHRGINAVPRRKSTRHGPSLKSSPFKGVTHYKRTGRWEAHIWNKGKQVYLGASSTAEAAARAYDRAALHFRQIHAQLNFSFEDYEAELQQLSDKELQILREITSFKGVSHYRRTGRWEAHIWNNNKQVYLGAFSTAKAAARAYDRAALHFRQMDAELNFSFEDYAGEMQQLVELSDKELEAMLLKQSAGDGTLYPEYPSRIEPQIHTQTQFEVPIYFSAGN